MWNANGCAKLVMHVKGEINMNNNTNFNTRLHFFKFSIAEFSVCHISSVHTSTLASLHPLTGFINVQRSYSTKNTDPKNEFWRKVNTSDLLDNDNPFILANNFLKEYPKLATKPKLAKDLIDLELISSILSKSIDNFYLTGEQFENLSNIEPTLIELPVKDKKDFIKVVGKYGDSGTAGAYVFKNKLNGFCYVGSSISLAKRLSTGYLCPNLGDRKIDLAIKDAGLGSFLLYLYILVGVPRLSFR